MKIICIFTICLIVATSKCASSATQRCLTAGFNNTCPRKPTLLPKVGGGVPARPGQIPWQARIEVNGHICGAVIIDKLFLLTAAHCVHTDRGRGPLAQISSVRIKVGSLYTNYDSGGEVAPTPTEIISHPDYDHSTFNYDFAIIRLEEPLVFTENITSLCLPQSCDQEPTVGSFCLISGWGVTNSQDLHHSQTLQKALAPVINRNTCKQRIENSSYSRRINFTDIMLCAGFLEGGIDTCLGDSGGPLACRASEHSNDVMLFGIISFGSEECGSSGLPGYYARTCAVFPWIKATVSHQALGGDTAQKVPVPDRPGPVADPKSLSYHVRIDIRLTTSRGYHTCSGAVLERDWILTAASCVNHRNPSDITVKDTTGVPLGDVSRIVVHSEFDAGYLKNNFALLKMQNPIEFISQCSDLFPNKIAFPAPCKRDGQRLQGNCVASGYGAIDLSPGENPTPSLMIAKVNDLPRRSCKRKVMSMFDKKQSICAREHTSRKAPCQTDEGGPLVCNEQENSVVLEGIASIAPLGCNESSTVVLYSRVCTVSRWIASNLFSRK